jgi:hypothetical protein
MDDPAPPAPAGFALPPHRLRADGGPRRVGVEIEFAGLAAEAAADVVARALGGGTARIGPHAFAVTDTALGPATVSLDARYAHPESARALFGEVGARLAPLVGEVIRPFVPTELVTGPMPLTDLAAVDAAVAALRAAGARGTADSAFYAFGLHFNPELPALDAAWLAAYLKAFVIAEPWLERTAQPNSTRKLIGFADAFPEAYVRRVLDPGYWPGAMEFTADYLTANPTRNRGLDLLPALAVLDGDTVRRLLPREKINPRPTLHYRLPDARVSEPGWGIGPDWARWVAVERLACDRDALARLGQAYLSRADRAGDRVPEGWAETVGAALAAP